MTRDEERAIEWESQKLVRQYYYHVDHYEFEQVVALFTPDVDWLGLGVKLNGREELLEGLYGALGAGTIRHEMTNAVVNVVDEDHAESRVYGTLYSSPDIRYNQHEGPIAFEGPMQVVDGRDENTRTDEGWRISKRHGEAVFKCDTGEPLPLHIWAKDEGKMALGS